MKLRKKYTINLTGKALKDIIDYIDELADTNYESEEYTRERVKMNNLLTKIVNQMNEQDEKCKVKNKEQ